MSIKNKIIISSILRFVLGGTLIVLGLNRSELLLSMGVTVLILSAALAVRFIAIYSNAERRKAYEVSFKDERNIYIQRQSYAFAFFTSIWCELGAIIYCAYNQIDTCADMLSYLLCAQLILFVLSSLWISRRG